MDAGGAERFARAGEAQRAAARRRVKPVDGTRSAPATAARASTARFRVDTTDGRSEQGRDPHLVVELQAIHQLEEAMTTRAPIEQAKGAIMATERCGPDIAFEVLRTISQRENRKLRDVAIELVEQLHRPAPSTASSRAVSAERAGER